MAALAKARLVVVQGQGVPMLLEFQYNPEQYSLEKSALWSTPSGGLAGSPTPQFVSGQPATMSMEIFFDAFEEGGDVSWDIATLIAWTRPDPISLIIEKPRPPLLSFQWGTSSPITFLLCYLRSLSARYTLFSEDGTPVRATANITLEEVPPQQFPQNPTSGTDPGMRMHVLAEKESLHSVAFAEYGQARHWRSLAVFNNIDDPMRVPVGTRLLLPTPRDAAKLS